MDPFEVCDKYNDKSQFKKVTIQTFTEPVDDEDYLAKYVLIEGDAEALEFLGNILIVQAREGKECGFRIGPDSAGNAYFTSNSSHGIHIHRLPCTENGTVMAISKRLENHRSFQNNDEKF